MPDSSLFIAARARGAAGPLAALALALFAAPAQAAPSAEDIGVVRAGGRVTITASGVERAAKAGTILPLPSALETGRDGSADLRQGPTTIGVGPDTRLDFPAPSDRGDSFDRVVQPGGQAFYDVGPRGSRKLRVETPYLVAVIKGTQFNVVVTDDSTTISLFEGSLELLATDGEATVHLNAGEIAIRRKGEDAIRVIPMKDDAATAGAGKRGGGDGAKDPTVADTADAGGALPIDPRPLDGDVKGGVTVETPALPVDPVEGKTTVDVDTAVDVGSGTVDAGADASVDVGAGPVEAGVDAAVDAAVDLGAGTVEAGVDAALDLGAGPVEAGVDAGVDTAVDLGAGTVDAGVDAALDLGAGPVDAGVDAGVDTAVDLGAGTVDAGVDAAVDLGAGAIDAGVDAGVDTAVDLGAGTVDASLDVGADLGTVDAGVGIDAGIDLSGNDAGVDLGVDLLGTEVDLGVDLGGGSTDSGTAPETQESGGLLGGLGGILGRTGL